MSQDRAIDLKASRVDTDATMAANSDLLIPSQKAVKSYAQKLRPLTFSSGSDNDTTPALGEEILYTTTTATITVPTGATHVEFEGSGSGGGGASGSTATTGGATGGQGGQGGQGGLLAKTVSEIGWTAGSTTFTVTVNAAGTGGTSLAGNTTATGNSGNNGGTVTVTDGSATIVTFPGGTGGAGGGRTLVTPAGWRGLKSGSLGLAGLSTGTVTGAAGGKGYHGGGGGGGKFSIFFCFGGNLMVTIF